MTRPAGLAPSRAPGLGRRRRTAAAVGSTDITLARSGRPSPPDWPRRAPRPGRDRSAGSAPSWAAAAGAVPGVGSGGIGGRKTVSGATRRAEAHAGSPGFGGGGVASHPRRSTAPACACAADHPAQHRRRRSGGGRAPSPRPEGSPGLDHPPTTGSGGHRSRLGTPTASRRRPPIRWPASVRLVGPSAATDHRQPRGAAPPSGTAPLVSTGVGDSAPFRASTSTWAPPIRPAAS